MSDIQHRAGGRTTTPTSTKYAASAVLASPGVDRELDTLSVDDLSANAGRRIPALVGHRHSDVAGTWENLRIVRGQLVGDLRLASTPAGDYVRGLIDDDVPMGISIGFRSKAVPNQHGGKHHRQIDVLEASIVTVPANKSCRFITAEDVGPTKTSLERMEDEAGVRWARLPEPNIRALKILTQANRALARSQA